MVARDVLLAELTGGRVHLCHMSTRGSVELIRRAKERGVRVTAEVTPHHLSLTDAACEGYDTHAKMNPPLREPADVAALREGLKDGTIDCVASDHAPHAYDEKDAAFDWLARCFPLHDAGLVRLPFDLAMDPLRKDPRFDALVAKLGIPK